MAALDKNISVNGDPNGSPRVGVQYDLASGVRIYSGSLVFVNSSGYAVSLSPDQTMTCVGYNDGDEIDNTSGGNGDKTIVPRIGVINLTNGGDISADDVGKMAYSSDNQTAYLSSNSSTRSAIGPILGMNGTKVRALAGFPANRSLQTLEAVQPIDADLTAIAALSGTGLLAHTGSGTWAERTLTAPAAGITVTNGNGVSGNPTLVLANDLAAYEGLAATGMVSRTGDGSAAARTITANSIGLTVTNGDGVAGNPTLDNLYAPIVVADPGTGVAIPVTRSASIAITTAAAETNTLAAPTFVGQRLELIMNVRVGGDRVITASARINQAGQTIMTFGAAGDFISLVGVRVAGNLVWQVESNDGVALS